MYAARVCNIRCVLLLRCRVKLCCFSRHELSRNVVYMYNVDSTKKLKMCYSVCRCVETKRYRVFCSFAYTIWAEYTFNGVLFVWAAAQALRKITKPLRTILFLFVMVVKLHLASLLPRFLYLIGFLSLKRSKRTHLLNRYYDITGLRISRV